MFDKLEAVVKRFEELSQKLADPALYENPKELKKISEEKSHLEEIVETYQDYKKANKELHEAKELLKQEKDEDLRALAREELSHNESLIDSLKKALQTLLLPQDPLDKKNVMIEIRAGAGGDEASIFVGDLQRMYVNYAQSLNQKVEIISLKEGTSGPKEVIFSVMGNKAYSKLKHESGVHRVQRVPKTESQGRIHTSTATVAIMPEPDEIDFKLDMKDVRIDVFRSSGSGGQHVNTTDSAVRATHLPTGISVENQDQKSQIKNKEKALKILRNRIFDQMVREQELKEVADRRGKIGTGDRSERIRTYNYPQGRITDHRIDLTLYNLERIISGDLSPVVDALVAYHQALLLGKEE